VLVSDHQDQEAVPHASRRRALGTSSLRGNSLILVAFSFKRGKIIFSKLFLQLEISHKNQVPMLVGPPPKSRSLFSFLTKELKRATIENHYDYDPE